MRPLRGGRSVTLIYDTIPLRHGAGQVTRMVKRAFLTLIGRLSTRIATLSDYSASCLHRDLGIPQAKISKINFPTDDLMRDRVKSLRRAHPSQQVVLYVGRFAPHKNLPRLIEAFGLTRLAKDGTRLLLVGGSPKETEHLRETTPHANHVEFREACSQEELELLYATSRLLVMPSLEEGYGLPAWEATTCGLRVALSDIPVFQELFPHQPKFDPRSIREMAEILDIAADVPEASELKGPSVAAYSEDFAELLQSSIE